MTVSRSTCSLNSPSREPHSHRAGGRTSEPCGRSPLPRWHTCRAQRVASLSPHGWLTGWHSLVLAKPAGVTRDYSRVCMPATLALGHALSPGAPVDSPVLAAQGHACLRLEALCLKKLPKNLLLCVVSLQPVASFPTGLGFSPTPPSSPVLSHPVPHHPPRVRGGARRGSLAVVPPAAALPGPAGAAASDALGLKKAVPGTGGPSVGLAGAGAIQFSLWTPHKPVAVQRNDGRSPHLSSQASELSFVLGPLLCAHTRAHMRIHMHTHRHTHCHLTDDPPVPSMSSSGFWRLPFSIPVAVTLLPDWAVGLHRGEQMDTSGPGVGEAMGLGDLCVLVLLFPARQQPSCQHGRAASSGFSRKLSRLRGTQSRTF